MTYFTRGIVVSISQSREGVCFYVRDGIVIG